MLLRAFVTTCCLLGCLVQMAFAVEIVAHRGASADAPENTVVAMKLGFEQQAEAGELDVWISKEGRAVVIHDGDTKRVAGVAKKVADQTLEELQSLDVGKWKDAKFAGTRIPTLEEALATCPPGKRIFVEVKCGPSGVPEILRAIQAAGLEPKQTAIISFNADVVAAAKKGRPDLQAYWIVGMQNEKKEVRSLDELIATAHKIGADGLDLSDHPVLDAKAVQKVKEAKLGFYVWTVNDPTAAKRLVQIGVDGITTDRPGFLKQELGLSSN